MTDIYYENLIKEIKKCKKSKDVPVAAFLVKDKKIVAKSINTREKDLDIAGHAEIKVINKMFKKIGNKNLEEFNMVVSLKPCFMCIGAIQHANIKKVYYYLENLKCDYHKFENNIKFIKLEDLENKLEMELKHFFKNLRNK
ncbi:tRNA(adenine34) deaminase [Spiroplasma chinense]|uniref:tRNA(Adenine34) deaminase n=1 Tax=Spiroplasma chinense TaxID=216932 RepID=A0A5B9Y2C0_9MOLU|nr:nucleoside deaminase [Spiroplasma chinense]QEH61204.1 tRNA(adenine34) deaminase [Spiroplasma chinense]